MGLMTVMVAVGANSFAGPHTKDVSTPCENIIEICKAAGFIQGNAKKGDGLWKDCVVPVIQGKRSPPQATKPLPIVDSATIAACKAKKPNFGANSKTNNTADKK